jgi:hypothetical protein
MDDIRKNLVETDNGSYLPVVERLKLFLKMNNNFQYGITTVCLAENEDYVTYSASFVTREGIHLFTIEHSEPVKKNYAKTKNKAQLGAIAKLLAMAGFGIDFAPELKTDVLVDKKVVDLKDNTEPTSEISKLLIKNLNTMIQTLNDLYPDENYTLEAISQEVLNKKMPENEAEAKKIKRYIQQVLASEK